MITFISYIDTYCTIPNQLSLPDVVRPISDVEGVKSDRLFLISIAFVSSSKRLILSAVASSKP